MKARLSGKCLAELIVPSGKGDYALGWRHWSGRRVFRRILSIGHAKTLRTWVHEVAGSEAGSFAAGFSNAKANASSSSGDTSLDVQYTLFYNLIMADRVGNIVIGDMIVCFRNSVNADG